MNNDTKLKVNEIIAKALALKAECPNCKGKGYTIYTQSDFAGIAPKMACMTCMGRCEIDYKVDIFTNDTDLKDAVIYLGGKALGICATDSIATMWFVWDEHNQTHLTDTLYPTYEDAVAAAYLALAEMK